MPPASPTYPVDMAPGSTFPRSLEIELGTPGVTPTSVTGVAWIDQWEDVPELRWPAAATVYDRMRKDSKVRGGVRALVAPVLARARYRLSPEGCDPRVLRFCQVELGLQPEERSRARRRRQGIDWIRYAREAHFTKAYFGHAVFEQVYDIGAPGPDQAMPGMPGVVAHLAKLAPRPPRSLGDPIIEHDGGLAGWKQTINKPGKPWQQIVLPINRIVVHVLEQEGAEWRGQSLLRAAWKHWAIRDVLFRIGAMAVERNGMGIPIVSYDENLNGTRARAIQLAKAVRAGDEAAVALPAGYELTLLGVAGQTRDELELVKYHGEMIGHALTTQVLDLGHDAGARSLGDTFLELLAQAQNAYADEFCNEVTEHVVRDLVELNFGLDEPVPPVIHDQFEPANVTWDDIVNMAKVGLIIPDDEIEAEIRRRKGLPLWAGAADGPADFGVDRIITPVPDDPSAPPAVDPNLPMPVAARSLDSLEAQATAVLATVAARRAAASAHPAPVRHA